MCDALTGLPELCWWKEIDEPVELLVEHWMYRYAPADEKARWREWCKGYWTDFNGGGWVWNGLCGQVIRVRAVLAEVC
ncbi:hypothetical protein CCR94_16355 [Rhodoblastus sphagnicola]|uniref:Uncharacterized protein n=1 Tax=Rhodoblastus sphagnicola TaxID=333368 RepID=A0A2S6N2Z1_9HYPH|nr:hypothetical protein [Rhodoblastus sphagnicola]MBB4199067.1 hypothetical protein [Rhodoblastus sphagnicola]PPQ28962.1 hypothetical protein CCR94_16355 [Rhodoblastus sphagnicola]